MKGKEKEQLYQKRNYDRYRFSMKELLKYMGQALALCIMADYLFYKSKWVLLLMLPVPVFYLKWQKNRMIRERRKNLNYQFKDALTSLSVAVQAGYSVESAVKTCVRDLERLYGKGTDIVEEFRYIESQQHISVPLEELFLDLGERSQIEDIENFASVFYTAKRTGGDMNRVIQKVSRMLGDKIDVKKEIEATLAAKKSEQMIMSLMPVGIILYLQMTSPGFLSVLYGNPFGIAAMSICLVIYAAAYWLGRRIVDTCCHFCYDPVCTDRLEKRMDSIFRNRREGWYQTFCGSSDSRKSAGHDPYFAKRWTGVSSGIPSGKGGYRII